MRKIALTLLLLAAAAPPAWGDRIASDRGLCRLSFAHSLRALAVSFAFRSQVCHRDRLRGKVDAAVDCNDPWSWTSDDYPVGLKLVERDLGRYRARSARCPQTVATTAEIGHVSCPSPCASLPTSTFPELGTCLECVAADATPAALAAAFGTPPVPGERAAVNCMTAIGRGLARHYHRRKKLQNDCEFLVEIQKTGWVGVVCADLENPTHPYSYRMGRFRERVAGQITRKCRDVDLDGLLDACGDTPESVAACSLDIAEDWTATMHAACYPPLP